MNLQVLKEYKRDWREMTIFHIGLSYWLDSENSFYPIGRYSYDEEVDRSFRKGNIKSLRVKLYKQDRKNPDSEYQLIQTFEANAL